MSEIAEDTNPLVKRSWSAWWSEAREDKSNKARKQRDDAYMETLCSASTEDFSDLEQLEFLRTDLRDRNGQPVIIVLARHFPVEASISLDRLFRYVIRSCDKLVEEPYSLIWLHTRADYRKNCPSVAWLWRTYERLPDKYRENLRGVRVVHCDLTLWLTMMALCPWFSSNLWGKVEWLPRSDFLLETLSRAAVSTLPKWLLEHDELLDQHPLADYGMYIDKLEMQPGL